GRTGGAGRRRHVPARIEACLAPGDLPAGLGGDEFAILSSRGSDEAMASELAERLSQALSEPSQLKEVRVQARASIGVALCPRDGDEPQGLLQSADLAW